MLTTIFIAAPPGATWSLSIDEVHHWLTEHFSEPQISPTTSTTHTGNTYLPFEVDIDGVMRHGLYEDGKQLVLEDGSSEFWADTIVQFLRLLPPDSQAVALVEVNEDDFARIPRGADAASIVAVLDRLAG